MSIKEEVLRDLIYSYGNRYIGKEEYKFKKAINLAIKKCKEEVRIAKQCIDFSSKYPEEYCKNKYCLNEFCVLNKKWNNDKN